MHQRKSGSGLTFEEGIGKEWGRNGGGMREEWGRNGGGMGEEWGRNGGEMREDQFFANNRRAVLQITNCKPLE